MLVGVTCAKLFVHRGIVKLTIGLVLVDITCTMILVQIAIVQLLPIPRWHGELEMEGCKVCLTKKLFYCFNIFPTKVWGDFQDGGREGR